MFRDTLPWGKGTDVNDDDASRQMDSICDNSLEEGGMGLRGGRRQGHG